LLPRGIRTCARQIGDDEIFTAVAPQSAELLRKMTKKGSKYKSQTFSFVLTEASGVKKYGYCRRLWQTSPPECYVLLGYNPSFSIFAQILDIVERRRQVSASEVFIFLQTTLRQSFPAPGESIKFATLTQNGAQPDQYELKRTAGAVIALPVIAIGMIVARRRRAPARLHHLRAVVQVLLCVAHRRDLPRNVGR
jgi:hypothetical protein